MAIMNITETTNKRGDTVYIVELDQTRFLYPTNFGLNPLRSRFGIDPSKPNDVATIIVPDDGVKALMDLGIQVNHTEPNPEYPDEPIVSFVSAKINYNSPVPARMCLVDVRTQPPAVTPLVPETASEIDKAYDARAIEMVRCVLSTYQANPTINKRTLYLRTIYVHITNSMSPVQFDPWADAYGAPMPGDGLPF